MRIYRKAFLLAIFVSSATAAEDTATSGGVTDYQVIAQKLDAARNGLSPETGSSTYDFDPQAIQNLPQGSDTPVNDVLLQAPGVAQDSYGQLHVRGDHANLQYRINGILLPEGITGFGQTLDTHFIQNMKLLTGALPAEYGYRTAGVVDITTKSGALENGATSTVTAGDNDTLEGNQEFYGSNGPFNYYFSGSYDQNNRGIEPPTPGGIHDRTVQDKEFGYASYLLNPENRFSVIFGNATNRFEIPNNPGQAPVYMLNGTANYPSADLTEHQLERNTYGIGALQGTIGDSTDYQLAAFSRYSTVLYTPDPVGDLIFNGIASRDYNSSFTNGLQNDYTYRLSDAHTLRGGWLFSGERAASDTNSSVFSTTGPDCTTTACTPLSIIDNHSKDALLGGIYAQDEWKMLDKLTLNYGLRTDEYSAYVTEGQLEPRIGAIYDLTSSTTLHTGYAHYFTPPPTELIAPVTIAAFQNTTGAPPSSQSSPVKPEKADYFDAGVVQKVDDHLTLGADAYYKLARDLLDEGQFGQALIFAPFNYERGRVKGIEFTGDYRSGPFTAYTNLAFSNAEGKDVSSGQYNFAPDELSYIAGHWVHLDHDQRMSASAGASYLFYGITYGVDVINGSGLRDGFANTSHLPDYTQVDASMTHTFDLGGGIGPFDGRFSIINLFDRIYEIRDGSGIGVFAPQYGPRRTFLVSLSKSF